MSRRSLTVIAALALLALACGPTDPGRPGASEGPGPAAPQGPSAVLLDVLASEEAAPEGPLLATRTASYDLGLVELADGVRAPVRGLAAWPEGIDAVGGAPAPLVLVLHGSHPICRDDPRDYGSWPCPAGTEIENEQGLQWLLEALAARGNVALAPALNVQHSLGAGEPLPAVRTVELVARTLAALDADLLPVSAADVTDDVVLVGHSVGGQDAVLLARTAGRGGVSGPLGETLTAALGSAFAGREVVGLVLIQPALWALEAVDLASVPAAIVVSECDGDVRLSGANYVSERLPSVRDVPVALLLLDGGSHNATNTLLAPDSFPLETPRCEAQLLERRADWGAIASAHRQQLAAFLPGLVTATRTHDGLRSSPVDGGWAARVFDEPAVPDDGITLVVIPAGARPPAHPSTASRTDQVVDATLVDGITAERARVLRCPSGYYTPYVMPGSEPCHRPELGMLVGQPATLAIS